MLGLTNQLQSGVNAVTRFELIIKRFVVIWKKTKHKNILNTFVIRQPQTINTIIMTTYANKKI